ncbi:MAG: RNA polymerase subunit sigma-24 [Acidobacteriota bacterium]
MLHIHNGDASANIAKQSSLPGEHFAFREALIDGPIPAEVKDVNAFKLIRARHLSDAYGVDPKQGLRDLTAQEAKLASFREHDEVVLWFEYDLFCQIHLIYLLDWYGRQQLEHTRLSLICIGEFSGKENFRGLGELTAEELASLFPRRQQVTQAQLDLATAAWQAYCSADPTDIEKFLQTDTLALPFLEASLRAHLRRFPSNKNGLGRIEDRALELIYQGHHRFTDLFPKFAEAEPVYGLGDAQLWAAIRRMIAAESPLLMVAGLENERPDRQTLTPEIVSKAGFKLTELGHAVLRDEADFVFLAHIDYWLGGVHLKGSRDLWRWAEQAETVFLSRPH